MWRSAKLATAAIGLDLLAGGASYMAEKAKSNPTPEISYQAVQMPGPEASPYIQVDQQLPSFRYIALGVTGVFVALGAVTGLQASWEFGYDIPDRHNSRQKRQGFDWRSEWLGDQSDSDVVRPSRQIDKESIGGAVTALIICGIFTELSIRGYVSQDQRTAELGAGVAGAAAIGTWMLADRAINSWRHGIKMPAPEEKEFGPSEVKPWDVRES